MQQKSERNECLSYEKLEEIHKRYGGLSLTQSGEKEEPNKDGRWHVKMVILRARTLAARKLNCNLFFVVFCQQLPTLQGIQRREDEWVFTLNVQWEESIPTENVVLVIGLLRCADHPVKR